MNKSILSAQIGGYPCQNGELSCDNGGVCRKTEGGFSYCDCPTDFEGNVCQFSKGSNQIFYKNIQILVIVYYSLHISDINNLHGIT